MLKAFKYPETYGILLLGFGICAAYPVIIPFIILILAVWCWISAMRGDKTPAKP